MHEDFDQNQQKITQNNIKTSQNTPKPVYFHLSIITNITETSKPSMIFSLVHIKEISEVPSMFNRIQVAQVRQLVWQILK